MSDILKSVDDRTPREKLAEGDPLTDAEKLEYIFEVVVKLEKLADKLSPQVESLANGPMASMLGMLGGFGR